MLINWHASEAVRDEATTLIKSASSVPVIEQYEGDKAMSQFEYIGVEFVGERLD